MAAVQQHQMKRGPVDVSESRFNSEDKIPVWNEAMISDKFPQAGTVQVGLYTNRLFTSTGQEGQAVHSVCVWVHTMKSPVDIVM